MLLDIAALTAQRDAIQQDGDGSFVAGRWEGLMAGAHLLKGTSALGDLGQLPRHLRATANRLSDLRTIPAKLDWMRERRDEGTLDPYAWMHFAASDVNSFFATARSLFDHLTTAIALTVPKPGGVPNGSFRKLRDWTEKQGDAAAEQLSPQIAKIVNECDWFAQLRDIRDDLVHRDADTIVFPEAEGIALAIHKGWKPLLDEPALTDEADLVRFERLSAATSARIFVLLEESAQAMVNLTGITDAHGGTSHHFGLDVLRDWSDELIGLAS